ncbi:MAG: hypothetical protein IJZ82_10100 [Lachnospiraceae bacterium]|nr:hypothetical protein [Lachnospiraceae bacterium]
MNRYRGIMKWKKRECRRRRIRSCTKSEGKIEICMGMFFCMLIFLAVLCQVKLLQYQAIGAFVEDSLAAAGLASAVIDVREYGRTHTIVVESPESSFEKYKEALIYNLALDAGMQSRNEEVLLGKVDILSYQIFNVTGDVVTVYHFQEDGSLEGTESISLSQAYLPDGNKVETTSVYSKVGFYVAGLNGERIYATKEKSVDIKGDG